MVSGPRKSWKSEKLSSGKKFHNSVLCLSRAKLELKNLKEKLEAVQYIIDLFTYNYSTVYILGPKEF